MAEDRDSGTEQGRATPTELSATLPDGGGGGNAGGDQRLGKDHRFTILEAVGEGAMGVVMAAYDPSLDRKVALKLLHRRLHGDSADEATARLLREAQAMAQVSHPNVVIIHDVGLIEDQVFIAMEYVDGLTLERWRHAEPRSWRTILDVYAKAGRGLGAAHQAGLVHRDFKPENVLVGADGRVKVTDFGLVGSPERSSEPTSAAPPSVALTRTGALLGTPAYMAPEQHLGLAVDARADQFAFCVALYEALYGERPFRGHTVTEIADQVLADADVEAPHGEVPAWIGAVVCQGLRRRPDQRHASMDQLLSLLDYDARSRRRRRMLWAALAIIPVVALAIVLAVVGGSSASSPCTNGAELLAGVWDGARKQEIGAAFTATDVPYASATWQTVAGELDLYAAAIVAMRSQSCRATFVDHEQSQEMFDLRFTCLEHRVHRLQALTDVMITAERDVVGQAVYALARLPPVADCGDRHYLEQRTAPPDDPATRARLRGLERQVAQLHSLLDLGRFEAAGPLVEDLSARAAELAHPPFTAQVLYMRGLHEAGSGDHAAAAATFEQALLAALSGRDERIGARIATALVYVAGYWLRAGGDAQRWSKIAEALLTAIGGEAEIEAELADHRGIIAYVGGNFAESAQLHRRAITLIESSHGATNPRLTKALLNLSSAQDGLGHTGEARATLTRCLALATARYGDDHPIIGSILTNQARLDMREQHWADSLAMFEHALAIKERALGPDNPRLASTLNNIGYVLSELGRVADSIPYYERALAIRSAALGDTHPALINTHINLALTLIEVGRLDDAEHESERAEACARAQGDPGASFYPLALRGRTLALRGKRGAALALLERAYALRGAPGVVAQELADAEFWLAQLLVEDPRTRRRALLLADRAQSFNRDDPARRDQTVEVDTWLARQALVR